MRPADRPERARFFYSAAGTDVATPVGMAPRSDWKNLNPFRPGGTFPLANPMEDPLATRPKRGPRGRRLTAKDREEFGPVDVHNIRDWYGQTQEQFARMLGISVGTLRNWEQGKRCPLGPARALLRIAAADPEAVSKVLRWNRSRWTDTSGIHE